jgi:NAD(P)-dependent dehydrogenase (short-subunit alcohol dehydrogenase family)
MKNLSINKLFNFKNKIIVITGSSGLLGTSFAQLFLDMGSTVVGLDKSKNKIKNDKFYFFNLDISDEKKINKILKFVLKKFKKIDVIINNAGISYYKKFEKRTKKELNSTFNTNLVGTINICKNYLNFHKKFKLDKCSIINIGSIYGILSPDFNIYGKSDNINSEIYGATKAGIIQFTKYFSVYGAKYNINVNCLSPGGVLNSIKTQKKKFIQNYSRRVPLNRMANVDDFFTCLMFLASDKSSYVTGQNIVVDGGLSAW